MQVVLVMFRGDGAAERRSFSLARDVTVVGRREDCDFRIPLGEISRKHCRLIKNGSTLRVEDLGSSNGTFHNGKRIQNAEINPGDTLQMGSVAFVVQIDGAPLDDDMQPVTAGSRDTAAARGMDDSDVTVQTSKPPHANGNGHPNGEFSGEFDPMSVLEADGSGELPALNDRSALGADSIIDVAEPDEAASDRA